MSKLEIAKEVIRKHFNRADCGIFDCYCLFPDNKEILYNKDGLKILICYEWAYFEVFGMDDMEFAELKKYYTSLEQRRKRA